ncbi:MAG TPA: response regulator transcription factor [Catalimonadaceae bacterium]|jgi:DNA-binding response OmpR family regulator|nr:response regulator transcription factor [Catalimonadaceae bacterium]
MPNPANILFAEDDENLRFVIQDNLELRGFNVITAEDGQKALELFSTQPINICIFDVMMPRMDGFTLASKVREKDPNVPILFLTSKGQKEDRLQGFKSGGDDYLTKPFSIEELVFRIEVFLKRSVVNPALSKSGSFKTTKFEFLPNELKIKTAEGISSITYKEAELLQLFIDNQDQVLKREDILMKIWGTDDYYKGRSLDVFISKVRKYLSVDPDLEIITVHGVGFKFVKHDRG